MIPIPSTLLVRGSKKRAYAPSRAAAHAELLSNRHEFPLAHPADTLSPIRGENSPKHSRIEPLNQSSRSAFQTICGPFSLSQRVGPLASEASANSCVVHLWVRENRSVVNPIPVQGEGAFVANQSQAFSVPPNALYVHLLFLCYRQYSYNAVCQGNGHNK
jgi:hypothetical protein